MSIDRIDSTLGYTRKNVRLVCHAANRMKGDATDADVFKMARAIVANMAGAPSWQSYSAITNESDYMLAV